MTTKKLKINFLKNIITKSDKILNYGTFISKNYKKTYLLNLTKLNFSINYALNCLKNININTYALMLVTDFKNIKTFIKTLALKLNIYFVTGTWKGGYLTNIKWYDTLPNLIFNFGMIYSKNFYNEIKKLCIPTIFFLLKIYFLIKKCFVHMEFLKKIQTIYIVQVVFYYTN